MTARRLEEAEPIAVSVLGPVRLSGPSGTALLTARRQLIVLATLVWQANRVVSIDSLIDTLWPDAPPDTARSQVHISVSGIRKRLARCGLHQLLDTVPPGYLLHISDHQLDVWVLNDLVARARDLVARNQPTEAVECLSRAMALWRGEPFAGVDNERVRSIATHIRDRRTSVCEDFFDMQIANGRALDVIDDLVTLVAENPFRERLHGQLMIALYRAGRKAEALRVYRQTHSLFRAELGMEPGPELRRLEQEILADDDVGRPVSGLVSPGLTGSLR